MMAVTLGRLAHNMLRWDLWARQRRALRERLELLNY